MLLEIALGLFHIALRWAEKKNRNKKGRDWEEV